MKKESVKSLFYLDRDTDINALASEILQVKREQKIIVFTETMRRLQEKEAGSFFTVEDILQLKDGELENIQQLTSSETVVPTMYAKNTMYGPRA